ncbi:NAD+ synthase [Thorsellia anophelis]|uniref:Glutamine-dependent NAD(+) synthetase n=1 Tax=Thorsellia anophelis DSM 18579 TaxID=1123402 RepID=A0A1I0DVL9_9GAMM|nr:NAD+ synthase [Thorsellia anophelis]SET36562.1 NAD+ synthase (glutamine-hydrolysing) [Thorsellia anophelis DSM 18579]
MNSNQAPVSELSHVTSHKDNVQLKPSHHSDTKINLGLAQLNLHVGHIEKNLDLILKTIRIHKNLGSDLVVFSELTITGYSPEDVLFRRDLHDQIQYALKEIQNISLELNIAILIGYPMLIEDTNHELAIHSKMQPLMRNCASLIDQGKIIATYFKRALPNYAVFDEKRYFNAGHETCVIDFRGIKLGILICEDLWLTELIDETVAHGAEIILSLHGSPFALNKPAKRQQLMQQHVKRLNTPLIYVNQIGGQDDLIFDGQSFALNSKGELVTILAAFAEDNLVIPISDLLNETNNKFIPEEQWPNYVTGTHLSMTELDDLYQALVLATRDYVLKNGFKGITLGLSGGIDSALTLAIAVDALGAQNCQAVMLPFRYTSEISILDAKEEAELLGVQFDVISIEPMFEAFMNGLSPLFDHLPKDTTEENLQARCRGVILMAISNKQKRLVLTTSNKSEVSVGYSTLYGDMAGGFNVLKDVPKTWVYALSAYRNQIEYVIPERVITRAPSAELAPDQTDQDNLPPYDILDPLLKAYVEEDATITELLAMGFSLDDINRVVRLVNFNQYKRSQSPIGPKVTDRSFSRERRYPVTNGFNPFFKSNI